MYVVFTMRSYMDGDFPEIHFVTKKKNKAKDFVKRNPSSQYEEVLIK